jgi:hypothetical protein
VSEKCNFIPTKYIFSRTFCIFSPTKCIFSPTFCIFSPKKCYLVRQNAFLVRQNAIQSEKVQFSPTKWHFKSDKQIFLVRKSDDYTPDNIVWQTDFFFAKIGVPPIESSIQTIFENKLKSQFSLSAAKQKPMQINYQQRQLSLFFTMKHGPPYSAQYGV